MQFQDVLRKQFIKLPRSSKLPTVWIVWLEESSGKESKRFRVPWPPGYKRSTAAGYFFQNVLGCILMAAVARRTKWAKCQFLSLCEITKL